MAPMVAVGAAAHVRTGAVVWILGNASVFRIVMAKVAAMMGVVTLVPLAIPALHASKINVFALRIVRGSRAAVTVVGATVAPAIQAHSVRLRVNVHAYHLVMARAVGTMDVVGPVARVTAVRHALRNTNAALNSVTVKSAATMAAGGSVACVLMLFLTV